MTIDELNQKKATEVAKLGRIQERVHGARILLESAENAVARLESAFRTEQENAALEERDWPTPEVDKRLSTARGKASAAESALAATMGALAKQAAIIEGVEGEIFERRMEAFEAELEPAKENLFAVMREFCEAASFVEQIARRHSITPHTLSRVLYPSADGFTGFYERNARCALINGGLNLTAFLQRTYVGKVV